MPPRKEAMRVLTGVGENHRLKPSVDHMSMHFEGTGSSAKKMESAVYVDTRPLYPEEIVGKPYPINYTPPIFPKYDCMTWNAREHIRWYVNVLIAHSHDHELRLREFSKSLEEGKLTLSDLQHEKQRVYEGLLEYIRWFRDLSLLCYDPVEEESLVDVCIVGHEDPMEEEAKNMASSSSAPPPLLDEEMAIGRREATQVLTRVIEMNHEVAAVERSLMQVAYQEAKDPVKFSSKDLANGVVDGDRPLYLTAFLGAYQIIRALVDTGASTDILPLLTFDALGISRDRIIPEPLQVAGIGSL
nr:hypothetical protein CFP56_28281 [Quercus suber]